MKKSKLNLLKKFLKGACTAQEVQEFVGWINSIALEKEIDEDFRKFSQANNDDLVEVDSNQVYEIIIDRLKEDINRSKAIESVFAPTDELKIKQEKRTKFYRIAGIAASITLILVAFWFGSEYRPKGLNTAETQTSISPIFKSTSSGQKLRLYLPDGTKVKLNSGSSIEYSKATYGMNREVRITGEVFFDVVRDPSRPFRILTPHDMEVTVLGTSFSVNAADNEGFGVVAVKSGSVQVKNKSKTDLIVLHKGDYTKVKGDDPMKRRSYSNEDAVFGWVENKLVFKNTNLKVALSMIETWFGVQITSEIDQMDYDSFTATFDNPTLKEVLESVCHAFKLKYKGMNKSKITISE